MNENTRFLICALGIFFCYFYYGILQEKITRGTYGDEVNPDGTRGERFTYALALVGVQFVCNLIFAKAMLMANPEKEDTTHSGYYACCSLTYLLGMVTSNMALRWVPYPTQVIGKSAKPIPVMVLGVLIGNKKYNFQKYIFILMIVIGVALFMYKDSGHSLHKINEETIGLGELLLFLSLSMDGLTGAVQDRMRAESAPSGKQMMLAMNWWSTIMLTVALLGTGELFDFIAFATKYPNLWIHLGMLALTGALGQLFIFMMVSSFGPLSCSVVTTTRKFFTVLFSVLFFGNSLLARQWFGAVLVFSGLFADVFLGKKSPVKKPIFKDDAADKLIS